MALDLCFETHPSAGIILEYAYFIGLTIISKSPIFKPIQSMEAQVLTIETWTGIILFTILIYV
jgi:hypothetical protein